ncbi:MAG: PKD domain-containing protein [Crocinitomicaceae bacterium]|nr:PKD domain-containing protein [Crocinitomicaceae bacterium]
MKLRTLLFSLLAMLVSFGIKAQMPIDFSPINDGMTFNTCNGFIIDSGGQGGPGYSNNESTVITICPDTPGEIISIVFNLFSLDPTNTGTQQNPNVDWMAVYDGTSTAANSMGVYNTNQLQGVVIEATVLNLTGCLTLEFYSNSTGTGMFTASVACETPCNDPQAGGVILNGITTDSIRVCVDELVDFQEIGSFAQPGFNLVDYSWDFMDGTTGSGQNVSHSFSVPGQYRVQLFVTDDNGCSNPNLIDLEVLVATYPDFTGFPGDTSICMGESATFTADPESYEVLWNGFPGSQSVDDGCLPDTLLGVSQDIQLLQTGFSAGTVIANVNDIQSICIDLEHSYMGDLVIMIECPNGQNAILHQQGGGGTQLGVPIQADNVDCSDPATMGVPYTYCFTPTATETWVDWVAANGGGTLPAGNYASIDPLSNLVGCPTNGVWTLTVIDNWAADDGTLFSFGLTLDPSYYPAITQFEPQIGPNSDSSFWVNPAYQTGLSADGNILTVTPIAGQFTYTFEVTNDFGCTHDTSLVLTVDPLPTVDAGNDTTLCNGNGLQLQAQISGMVSTCNYILTLDDTFGDGWNGNTITITVNGVPTDYTMANGNTITFNLSIPTGATVDVTFNANGAFVGECSYDITDDQGATVIAQGPNLGGVMNDQFVADCVPDMVFEWTPPGSVSDPAIIDPTLTASGQQMLIFTTYPLGHPLCAVSDTVEVSISATPDPGQDAALEVCSAGAPEDLFPLLGVTASVNGSWLDPAGNPVNMPFDPQTMPVGIYVYFVDSNGCTDQAEVTITEIITNITNSTFLSVGCNGGNDGSITITGNNIDFYSIDGGAQVPAVSPFTVNGLVAATYTIEVFSVEGCSDLVDVIVTEPTQLTAALVITDAICFDQCDGEVLVIPSGGIAGYGYNWQGGVNGNQQGVGIDICAGNYSVDITDANGCTITEQYVITEPADVVPSVIGDTLNGCVPHQVDFVNTTASNDVVSTTVDFGDGSEITVNGLDPFEHTYDAAGVYTITLTMITVNGCEYSVTYTDLIEVFNAPNANFMIAPNQASMMEPVVNIIDQSSGDVISWQWTIPDGDPSTSTDENISNLTFPAGVAAEYPITLEVVSEWGCTDSITKFVSIVNEVVIYAPNTFTPDGDEYNQDWFIHISGVDIYDFELYIFNRWGEIIWESHDATIGWDGAYHGEIVQSGTYQWVVRCTDILNDNKYEFNGHINLIK